MSTIGDTQAINPAQGIASAKVMNKPANALPPPSQQIHQVSKNSHYQRTVNFLRANPRTAECFLKFLKFTAALSRPLLYLISIGLMLAGGLFIAGSLGTASMIGLPLAAIGLMMLAPAYCYSIENALQPNVEKSVRVDGKPDKFQVFIRADGHDIDTDVSEFAALDTINIYERNNNGSNAVAPDSISSLIEEEEEGVDKAENTSDEDDYTDTDDEASILPEVNDSFYEKSLSSVRQSDSPVSAG